MATCLHLFRHDAAGQAMDSASRMHWCTFPQTTHKNYRSAKACARSAICHGLTSPSPAIAKQRQTRKRKQKWEKHPLGAEGKRRFVLVPMLGYRSRRSAPGIASQSWPPGSREPIAWTSGSSEAGSRTMRALGTLVAPPRSWCRWPEASAPEIGSSARRYHLR